MKKSGIAIIIIFYFSIFKPLSIASQIILEQKKDKNYINNHVTKIIFNGKIIAYDNCFGFIKDSTGFVLGSGFIAINQNLVFTCTHVINNVISALTFEDPGRNSYKLIKYRSFVDLDLTIFKIRNNSSKYFSIGNSPKIGDTLFYIGWDDRKNSMLINTVRVNTIGKFIQFSKAVSFFEFNADVIPGYSGGVVLNKDGFAIGIMTMGYKMVSIDGTKSVNNTKVRAIELNNYLSENK